MNQGIPSILLVEDDIDFQKSLADRLSKKDYSVTAVNSAEDALKIIQADSFDAIISDIKLDGMDGLEFLERIKTINEDIPVILITGFATLETAKDAVALNAYNYLMKPLSDFSKLLIPLKNAVSEYRIKKENMLIKERFENIIRGIPDGIVTINNSFIIESVNKAFLKMFNFLETDVLNMNIKDIFDENILNHIHQLMNSIGLEDNTIRFEWTKSANKKETNRFWANITIKRAIIGRKDSILMVVSDITDLKRAEEEKKSAEIQFIHLQKQESLGNLAHGIAHEFNNILSIILGHTQLCMTEESLKEIRQSLLEVEKATMRGSKLVDNMSSFATPHIPHLKAQDIRETINETLNLQKRQFHLQNIKIEKKFNNNLYAKFDNGQMGQVFLNLLLNSMHAIMPKGEGTISIETNDTEDQVEIIFSDTGTGIDESILEKIFDPFFTTKGAYAKDNYNISGTGLGLSVANAIISQHFGTITVSSKKAIGTVFNIKLPAVRSDALKNKSGIDDFQEIDLEKIKKMRILLVDDEEEMVKLMDLVFKKAGFENFLIVNNGKKVLTVFREFDPEITFLDLLMPDMDGREVAREIKKIKSDALIVFMSGKIDINKDELNKEKPFDYIKKPFNINSLYQILFKVLNE